MNTAVDGQRRRVLLASLTALVLGSLVAVAAVLPAEYGIDPTGLGRAMGLLQLATGEPENAAPAAPEPKPGAGVARVEKSIELASGEGIEFKLNMRRGEQASFRWTASAVVHFDQHGEPAGDTTGYYESYAVGHADAIQGKFTALFDGTHGWYWRNDQAGPVTIELTVAGAFDTGDGGTR